MSPRKNERVVASRDTPVTDALRQRGSGCKFVKFWGLVTRWPEHGFQRSSKVTRLGFGNLNCVNHKLLCALYFVVITMSTTDWLYLAMLVGSIPLGHLVKISGSPARKQFLCMAAGVCLSLALVGVWGILHSFVTILGTYLIVISFGPR